MQLIYRGVRYNTSNHPIEVIQSTQEGRFLGARYRIASTKGNLPKRSSSRYPEQLSYRLAKYTA